MSAPTLSKRYVGIVSLCACIAAAGTIAPRGPAHADTLPHRAGLDDAALLRLFEKAASERPLVAFLALLFAGAAVAGVVIDARAVARLLRRRTPTPAGPPGGAWGLAEVLRAGLLFLSVFFALQALAPLLLRFPGGLSNITLQVAFQFLAELAAVAYLIASLPAGSRGRLDGLGVAAGRRVGAAIVGVKAYVGFLPVLVCLVAITRVAAERGGIALEAQAPMGFFFADLSAPALVFLAAFVAVVGPIFEEIFFRGFAYQALRRRWGRLPGVVATSLVFSALHANTAVFLPIFGLGVLLACAFEATGSLVAPITIHICQNGVAVAAALLLRSASAL